MGAPSQSNIDAMWTVADKISLFNSITTAIGILVNVAFGIWIVKSIQNRLQNKRSFKDYCISELKDIRQEYRVFLNNLHSGKVVGSLALAWFKLMNIKVQDYMNMLHDKFNIDPYLLDPYQNSLRELVTNNKDFNEQFSSGEGIKFSVSSLQDFYAFQQNNLKLFNQIVVEINEK